MLQTAQELQKAGIPVVMYGNNPELREFDRVISDHEQGNYELTKWLIDQGCRRILRVLSEEIGHSYWLEMRQQGYLRAMREAALSPHSPCCHPTWAPPETDRELFQSAVQVMAKHLAPYLASDESVQALMAVSDGDVYVLAAACRLLGKEPNRDVLIVGYDHYWADSDEREHETTVPLATIDKRNPELGVALVQVLNERIEGQLPQNTPHCRCWHLD
jgi:DNA-binding LacI/PurR family transcriptional regulator